MPGTFAVMSQYTVGCTIEEYASLVKRRELSVIVLLMSGKVYQDVPLVLIIGCNNMRPLSKILVTP